MDEELQSEKKHNDEIILSEVLRGASQKAKLKESHDEPLLVPSEEQMTLAQAYLLSKNSTKTFPKKSSYLV